MRKEALMVGVGNFRGYAEPLPGAVVAMHDWAELLRTRDGFKVETLQDEQAIRHEILARFKLLVTRASPGDQLVLGFFTHGRVVPVHDANGTYRFEEALIAYPEGGDLTLRRAEIIDDDLAEIIRDAAPPPGTDLTIIIDACFAGFFNFALPLGAKLMFVPPSVDFGREEAAVKAFGSLEAADGAVERPLVLAACGRKEEALHIVLDEGPHTLFSSRAVDWLRGHPDATFGSLCADIQPLREGIEQTPEVRGNTARAGERFPGEHVATANALSMRRENSPWAMLTAMRLMTAATNSVNWMDVRIDGICCLADARSASDPYAKRLLLPYDDRTDPVMRHVAFIEVAEDDCTFTGTGPTETEPHHGAGYLYHRWHLQGHKVVFDNTDTNPPLGTTLSYREHVAGLKRDVNPQLEEHPRAECFDPNPPAGLVAAYVDLASGVLSAGPLQKKKTRYVKKDGTPLTSWNRKAPEFVNLHLPLLGETGQITITPQVGAPTTIHVKPGGSVRIGNMREVDIIGATNAQEAPREHFYLYYKLSAIPVGADPPLPYLTAVPVNSCSVHGWP